MIVSKFTVDKGKTGDYPPKSRHISDLKMSPRSIGSDRVCVKFEAKRIPGLVCVKGTMVVTMFRSSRSPAHHDTAVTLVGSCGPSIDLSRAAAPVNVASTSELPSGSTRRSPISAKGHRNGGVQNSEPGLSKPRHHHFPQYPRFLSGRATSA